MENSHPLMRAAQTRFLPLPIQARRTVGSCDRLTRPVAEKLGLDIFRVLYMYAPFVIRRLYTLLCPPEEVCPPTGAAREGQMTRMASRWELERMDPPILIGVRHNPQPAMSVDVQDCPLLATWLRATTTTAGHPPGAADMAGRFVHIRPGPGCEFQRSCVYLVIFHCYLRDLPCHVSCSVDSVSPFLHHEQRKTWQVE